MTEANNQNVVQGQCGKCEGKLFLKQPVLRVQNWPEASMFCMIHEKPQLCEKCGTAYVPLIKGITPDLRLIIEWAAVEYKQQAIVAPTPHDINVVKKSALIQP